MRCYESTFISFPIVFESVRDSWYELNQSNKSWTGVNLYKESLTDSKTIGKQIKIDSGKPHVFFAVFLTHLPTECQICTAGIFSQSILGLSNLYNGVQVNHIVLHLIQTLRTWGEESQSHRKCSTTNHHRTMKFVIRMPSVILSLNLYFRLPGFSIDDYFITVFCDWVATDSPTLVPTCNPTLMPTVNPSTSPSSQPSTNPTRVPSKSPTNCNISFF